MGPKRGTDKGHCSPHIIAPSENLGRAQRRETGEVANVRGALIFYEQRGENNQEREREREREREKLARKKLLPSPSSSREKFQNRATRTNSYPGEKRMLEARHVLQAKTCALSLSLSLSCAIMQQAQISKGRCVSVIGPRHS